MLGGPGLLDRACVTSQTKCSNYIPYLNHPKRKPAQRLLYCAMALMGLHTLAVSDQIRDRQHLTIKTAMVRINFHPKSLYLRLGRQPTALLRNDGSFMKSLLVGGLRSWWTCSQRGYKAPVLFSFSLWPLGHEVSIITSHRYLPQPSGSPRKA